MLRFKLLLQNLKKNKSAGGDQILAELIQTGCEILLSAIQELINAILELGRIA
jgi:hypothetical protein